MTAVTEMHSIASLDTGNKIEICAEFVEKEHIIEEMAEDLTLRESFHSNLEEPYVLAVCYIFPCASKYSFRLFLQFYQLYVSQVLSVLL